jgi:hypothetical protein
MTEFILIGILLGLLILWILNINSKLNETYKELERMKLVLSCKEQWEFNKYDVERLKEFARKEHDFVKLNDFINLLSRIEKIEKD